MKVTSDFNASIGLNGESRVRRYPECVWDISEPEEIDLVSRVCISASGEIDPGGSIDYHSRLCNGNGKDNDCTPMGIDGISMSGSELDIIRRVTLDWLGSITGLTTIRAKSAYLVNVSTPADGNMVAKIAALMNRSDRTKSIHFGLHTLMARASYAALTCGNKWPKDPRLAAQSDFCSICNSRMSQGTAWHIAADSGFLWNFLTNDSLYIIASVISEYADKLMSNFRVDQIGLLSNGSAMVKAMTCDCFAAYTADFGKLLSTIHADDSLGSLSMVIDSIKVIHDEVVLQRPSAAALSNVWMYIFAMINLIDGYLVGSKVCVANHYNVEFISETSYAYRIGYHAGSVSAVGNAPNDAMRGFRINVTMVVDEILAILN